MAKQFLDKAGLTTVLEQLRGLFATKAAVAEVESNTNSYILNINYENDLAFDTKQRVVWGGKLATETEDFVIDVGGGASFRAPANSYFKISNIQLGDFRAEYVLTLNGKSFTTIDTVSTQSKSFRHYIYLLADEAHKDLNMTSIYTGNMPDEGWYLLVQQYDEKTIYCLARYETIGNNSLILSYNPDSVTLEHIEP